MNHKSDLPVPDHQALALSARLTDVIKQEIIDNSGWISFQRYMEMALYEPGLGYYSAGSVKIGEQGDFITAPEVSSLFSQCIARQVMEVLYEIESGSIIELGAGTGAMARDVLLELQKHDCMPETYYILETSADLRQRQKATITASIPEFETRIKWLDYLPEQALRGVILANEVLDALPVKRFVIDGDKVSELGIGIKDDELSLLEHQPSPELIDFTNAMTSNWSGKSNFRYSSEWNNRQDQWIGSLVDVLAQGAIFFIDYGYTSNEYYHPDKTMGTLKCHYRHLVHDDPLLYPGLQDITASVNFSAVANSAFNRGMDVRGYTSQAHFLLSLGITDQISETDIESEEYMKLTRQIKLLTLPEEMGERFKVMALTKGYDAPLQGFTLSDQRGRL